MTRFSLGDGVGMETVKTQLKAWLLPAVVTALAGFVLGMGAYIFHQQNETIAAASTEIQDLRDKVSETHFALSLIQSNQSQNTSDRQAFQDGVNARLDKMQDVLTSLGQNMAALTALQKQRDAR